MRARKENSHESLVVLCCRSDDRIVVDCTCKCRLAKHVRQLARKMQWRRLAGYVASVQKISPNSSPTPSAWIARPRLVSEALTCGGTAPASDSRTDHPRDDHEQRLPRFGGLCSSGHVLGRRNSALASCRRSSAQGQPARPLANASATQLFTCTSSVATALSASRFSAASSNALCCSAGSLPR